MSHVEMKKVESQNLDALERAAASLGGELIRGQKTHAWWGSWVGDWTVDRSAVAQGRDPKTFGKCDHAIRIAGRPGVNGRSGPWEVGVVKDGDGFLLLYDNYGNAGRELERLFGASMESLANQYGAEVAAETLIEQGYQVWIESTPDGPNVHAESDMELY